MKKGKRAKRFACARSDAYRPVSESPSGALGDRRGGESELQLAGRRDGTGRSPAQAEQPTRGQTAHGTRISGPPAPITGRHNRQPRGRFIEATRKLAAAR